MQHVVISPSAVVSALRSGSGRRGVALSAAFVSVVAGAAVVVPGSAQAVVASCSSAGIGITALHGPVFYIDPSNSPAMTSAYAGYQVTNSTGGALSDVWVQLSGFTGGSVALGTGQPAAEQVASLPSASTRSLFWYLTASGASSSAQNHTVTVYSHRPGLADATPLCTTSGGFAGVSSTIGANANKITSVSLSSASPTLGATFSVTVAGTTGTIGQGPPAPLADPESLWTSPSSISGWPAGAYRLVGTQISISPDGSAAAQNYPDVLHLTNLGSSSRPYTAVYTFQATGFTASNSTLLPVEQISSGTQIKHTGSYPTTIPAIQPATNDLAVSATASPSRLPSSGGTSTYTATIAGTTGASLDSFTVTVPTGASVVSGSAGYDGAAIGDPVSDGNGNLVFQGPFTLTSATDTLTFQLTQAAGSGAKQTSIIGSVGTATIDTTPNDLTDDAPATATVVLNTAPNAVTDSATVSANSSANPIPVLANDTDADNDTLTVTAVTQPAHGTATFTSSGVTYTPNATFTGADPFTYSISDGHGGTATGSVEVTVATSLTAQTITFPPMSDASVLATPTAAATSDSGLAVSYSSQTPSVCTVDASSGAVTPATTGTCTIEADQPGDGSHSAAPSVQRSFTVTKAGQTITFPQPADAALAASTASVSATSSSGLAVAYASSTTGVCTVGPGTGAVQLVSTGTCTIEATQPGNATYSAATAVDRSFAVTTTPQTITFPQPADADLADGTTAVTATSDSGLVVQFATLTSATCTVTSGGAVTLLAAGTCTLEADQGGNAAFDAASPVQRSFTIAPAATGTPSTQSITFAPLADTPLLSGQVTASASADSGLAVDFTSATLPVCTVDATTGVVELLATGTCTIHADQSGDSTYAAAAQVSQSFEVTLTDQHITFAALSDAPLLAGTATASATSDSGLAVAFDSATPTTCSVDSTGTISLLATGPCTIDATQSGSGGYAAATPVSRTFSIVRSSQAVSFPTPPDGRVGDTVDLTASSGTGLTITYTAGPSTVCVVDTAGTGVTLIGTGTCSIMAHQAGNADYLPASAPMSLTVDAALLAQTITFPAIDSTPITATTAAASATASSALAVTYASLTPAVCGIAQNGVLTLHTTGTCTVQADQSGDSTYAAAPSATRSFAVVRATQTITLAGPTGIHLGDANVAVVATATSGLPVVYTSTTPTVCLVDVTGAVTLLSAGRCTVTASQAGSSTYDPAPDATAGFQVRKLPQTITLVAPPLEDVTIGSVAVTATSDAGLPVTVTAGPARVCTIDDRTVTLLRSGHCQLEATSPGDASHAAARAVHAVVAVTAQADDKRYTLPPTAPGSGTAGSTTIAVLKGDPGQTLVAVTQPPHGHVTIDGTHVTITVPAGYKGTETFTYTTKDAAGHRHTATVTITVPDSPPTITPTTTSTVAGSSRRVLVPVTDANHDRLTITVGAHHGAHVTVVGHRLQIVPDRSTSGVLTIPVTVHDGDGGVARTTVHVLVSPRPARSATRHLVPLGTAISWPAAAAKGARYAVTVDGRRLCVTAELTCTVAQFLGRHARVRVTVLGLDGTHSTRTPATPRTSRPQLAGTVYFATDSSVLSRHQAAIARALARRVRQYGFRSVSLIGYTDSRGSIAYNLALSHRRSHTVATLLRHRFHLTARLAWRGEGAPAATNTTARGMALNRRVEVWVR